MCFLQLIKKGRKKNVEQFRVIKNSFDTCPKILYIKHGHTQGLGDFRTNPLLRIFERKRSKGLGISGLLKRVRVAREGYARAYI